MYRTLDCDTWDDVWFAELAPLAKLLFLYFVTNRRTTPCGALQIRPEMMQLETGLTAEQLADALAALAPKVLWWPEHRVIWVQNFYRRQRANSNELFARSARKALATFPAEVQSQVGAIYPELCGTEMPPLSHTNPIPMPPVSQGGNITGTVTGTERETTPAPAPAHEEPDPPGTAVNRRRDAPRRVPERPLPATYPLTEEMRTWAAFEVPGLALDMEHKKFCAYYAARQNETRTEWRPVWEKWMLDAVTVFARAGPGAGRADLPVSPPRRHVNGAHDASPD